MFLKRHALIWADSRLCVSGNGKVWWEAVFERTESFYLGKRIVSGENAKFQFLRTHTFLIISKNFIGAHHSCNTPSPIFAPNFLLNPHQIPISTATKITYTFSFKRPLAAASTHRNFAFSQKTDSAFNLRLPFRTGSKHGRAYRGTNKLLQTCLIR